MAHVSAHAWVLILVTFAVTFGLRALPFGVRAWLKDSALLADLGKLMPVGIMVILVAYSFESSAEFGSVAAMLGVVVTAALHLWKGHIMVSLVGGVLTYGIILGLT